MKIRGKNDFLTHLFNIDKKKTKPEEQRLAQMIRIVSIKWNEWKQTSISLVA